MWGLMAPLGGTRGPLSHILPPLSAATLLSVSVCLSLRVGLFHMFSVLFYFIYSPFSSPSVRALPRGPALSSSASSVLGLF